MGQRRISREDALKILYQIDICQDTTPKSLEEFWEQYPNPNTPAETKEFTQRLVSKTSECQDTIDNLIKKFSKNWSLTARWKKLGRLGIKIYEVNFGTSSKGKTREFGSRYCGSNPHVPASQYPLRILRLNQRVYYKKLKGLGLLKRGSSREFLKFLF